MGLFSKRADTPKAPKPVVPYAVCPICEANLTKADCTPGNHWKHHVVPIEDGPHAGDYMWRCSCGIAMGFPVDLAAAIGLSVHMEKTHGIPVNYS